MYTTKMSRMVELEQDGVDVNIIVDGQTVAWLDGNITDRIVFIKGAADIEVKDIDD